MIEHKTKGVKEPSMVFTIKERMVEIKDRLQLMTLTLKTKKVSTNSLYLIKNLYLIKKRK